MNKATRLDMAGPAHPDRQETSCVFTGWYVLGSDWERPRLTETVLVFHRRPDNRSTYRDEQGGT